MWGFFETIYASGTERPLFEAQQVQICHSGGDALTFLAEVYLERTQKEQAASIRSLFTIRQTQSRHRLNLNQRGSNMTGLSV